MREEMDAVSITGVRRYLSVSIFLDYTAWAWILTATLWNFVALSNLSKT